MIIRVYDQELNTIDICRVKSLQWTRKFMDYGSFELHIGRDAAGKLKNGNIISIDKDRLCGIVKRVYCKDDDVTVNGYDLKGLCLQRVDIGSHSGAAGKVITDMSTAALTEGVRAIPNMQVEASELGEQIQTEDKTEKLSAKINTICTENILGYDIVKQDKSLIFKVLEPRDKSEELFFAPKRKNISAAEYEDSKLTAEITSVYNVASETDDSGETVKTVTEYDTGAVGFARVESYTTNNGETEEIEAAAEKAISDSKTEATVSAAIRGDGYLTEFDLGDYVTVSPGIIGGEEILAVKLITEVKEVYEHGKITVTPTFGEKQKSFIRRVLEQ